jgi:hypothetical protein
METKSALIAAAIIAIAAILFIAMQQPGPESGQGCAAGYSWCGALQKCIAQPQECGAPLPEGAELNFMGEGACEEQGGHVADGACPGGEFELAEVKGTGAPRSCCIEMPAPAPPQGEGGGVAAPLPLPQGTGEENEARP